MLWYETLVYKAPIHDRTSQPLIQVFHDYVYWVKVGIRDCTDYECPVTYMVVTRHYGYLIPVRRASWYTVIVWQMSGHFSVEASPCILSSVIYAGAPYRLLASNILQTVFVVVPLRYVLFSISYYILYSSSSFLSRPTPSLRPLFLLCKS